MVYYSSKNMDLEPSRTNGEHNSSFVWMRLFVILGGVGLAGSGGIALADSPEAIHIDDLMEAQGSYQTSADYLMPSRATTHVPTPSVVVNLTPEATPTPQFSIHSPSASIAQTSPPSAENQMQTPVPVPPPAAIIADAPAAAPSMIESLQQANQAADRGSHDQVVSIPTAQDVANEAAETDSQDSAAADAVKPAGPGGVFIDPTDYSLGATQAPTTTPNVVFADRSTGCQISVAGGQTTPNSTCSPATDQQTATAAASGGIQVGLVTVSPRGVSLGSTTVISREFLNEKLRPLNVLRRGNEDYVFPLSVPAPISSLFGWRMHPVHQSWRFHSGTDLAAPTGTPVLATRSGRVAVSDNLGGYGLTVILRHDEDNLESRYAHLSQVAVRPGEWVEQGEVIGLVGSTGTSTGPHLHFELRQLTEQGWIAVDAQEVLEYGIANLLQIIDNPLLALGQSPEAEATDGGTLPANLPFRPAQPNAS